MEEVDEGGRSWPDPTHVGLLGVTFHDVDVSLEAVLVGRAGGLDACVDDGDVTVPLQYLIESIEGEPALVDGEIFVIDHVVDIGPDGIEGDAVGLVSGDDVLEVGDVLVAPATLVEAQTPEGRQCCSAIVEIELFQGGLGVLLTEEEAEIDDASDDLEGEVVPAIRDRFDDVHGVGAAEVVDVEEVVPFLQHVEGEVPIGL